MSDALEPTFSHDVDVIAVADYLIALDGRQPEPDVTPMKLAKLLYLCQANYLASTGRRMFDEEIEAFKHGPVVYSEWKRHNKHQIIAASDPGPGAETSRRSHIELPADVSAFVDDVWARFGAWSAAGLRALTHDQAPWKDHYREGEFRTAIPDDEMAVYFREHVPADERVFHPHVVIIPDGFISDEDAEEFGRRVARYAGP